LLKSFAIKQASKFGWEGNKYREFIKIELKTDSATDCNIIPVLKSGFVLTISI
jgi:hypothetical protein